MPWLRKREVLHPLNVTLIRVKRVRSIWNFQLEKC